MSKVLLMTVGLPRSGKSTWALQKGHPVVNPDAIRLAFHGLAFVPHAEKMIWTIAHYMVLSLFHAGHQLVILDSTNNTRKRREAWKSKHWVRKYRVFGVDKGTCIERAKKDDREYLVEVIERMAAEFEPIEEDEWDQEDTPNNAEG